MNNTSKATPELPDFSKATPRPWKALSGGNHFHVMAVEEFAKNLGGDVIIVTDKDRRTIAYIGTTSETIDEDRDNAALIVHAVNSYDTMREQLSSANAEIERLRGAWNQIAEQATREEVTISSGNWDAAMQDVEQSDDWHKGYDCAIEFARKVLGNTTPSPDPRDAVIAELVGALEIFNDPDMIDMHDCEDNDGERYQSKWLSDAIIRARAVLAKQGGSDV